MEPLRKIRRALALFLVVVGAHAFAVPTHNGVSITAWNGIAITALNGVSGGGGGSPVFYDALDPALSDGSDANQFDNTYRNAVKITLGQSGTVTKIRFFAAFFNFSHTLKYALYDATGSTLIGSGSKLKASGTDNAWNEYVVDTPSNFPVVSGTTYLLSWIPSATGCITLKHLTGQPSGSDYFDFGTNYAAAPASTFPLTSPSTLKLAVGMEVTP